MPKKFLLNQKAFESSLELNENNYNSQQNQYINNLANNNKKNISSETSSFSSSSSSSATSNNSTANSLSTANSIYASSSARLNQGKLIYLDKKFSNRNETNSSSVNSQNKPICISSSDSSISISSTEHNYDELNTISDCAINNNNNNNRNINYQKSLIPNNSNCKLRQQQPRIETIRNTNKNKQEEDICNCCPLENSNKKSVFLSTSTSETNKKRLSCEELEDLKERFVDFIKLDTMPSSSMTKSTSDYSVAANKSLISIIPCNQNTFSKLASPPLPPPPAYLTDNLEQDKSKSILKPSNPCSIQIPNGLSSRLSVLSSESSSGESSLSSSSSSSSSSTAPGLASTAHANLNKPEPPQRTVSIRNSTCNSSIYSSTLALSLNTPTPSEHCYSRPENDCISIKSSSIYSSCRGSIGPSFNPNPTSAVRSSRSVFSIYEEEDESCAASSASSALSSSSSSSSASARHILTQSSSKLERLSDYEMKKIESMYRSIGALVYVSGCTCDFYTTTSEQIANLLNDCWKLETNSIVPVWVFDTGYNPKREKKLRLVFVDRHTAFPITTKPILINKLNQLKNPSNDKRLTFTLRNKQLVCLLQFYDFFTCQEFYKFYLDIAKSARNTDLFGELDENEEMETNSKKNQSRSMMSLSRIPESKTSTSLASMSAKRNKKNRYSAMITSESSYGVLLESLSKSKSSKSINKLKEPPVQIQQTVITKHCISSPCAFTHINSIKDGDHQRVKFILDTCNSTDKNLMTSLNLDKLKLMKKT